MKKIMILAVCFALGGMSAAVAQSAPAAQNSSSCFNTRMLNSTGPTIRLQTGQSYMVNPGGDRTRVTLWQPLDQVQVCRGRGSMWNITNLSRPTPQTITVSRQ